MSQLRRLYCRLVAQFFIACDLVIGYVVLTVQQFSKTASLMMKSTRIMPHFYYSNFQLPTATMTAAWAFRGGGLCLFQFCIDWQ
ncbi:hypothetical protein [Sideroxyarcus emersonii]|uniref:hypothetical protein n=1 Tax=Sideroxyarcus emersonii TaxID=2764705 RepID=UPI001F2544D8|nr:hypothetical protein [Sideroxyarcus emersonii]